MPDTDLEEKRDLIVEKEEAPNSLLLRKGMIEEGIFQAGITFLV